MQITLDFEAVLSRAGRIMWRNKVLWFFGVLAILGSGGSGGNFNFNYSFDRNNLGQNPEPPAFVRQLADRFSTDAMTLLVGIGVGLICFSLMLGLILFVLSMLGRGGLIGGASLADANERVSFGEAWQAARENFWRLAGLHFGFGLIVFTLVFGVICVGILAAIPTMGLGMLLILPLLCIIVPLLWIAQIFIHFANFAIVLEKQAIFAALGRAGQVIKNNWASILILGLILIAVSFIISLVLSLPLILVVIPALLGIVMSATRDATPLYTGLATSAVICALYLPILWLASGILETWVTATWTLAYKHFTQPAPVVNTPSLEYPGAIQ